MSRFLSEAREKLVPYTPGEQPQDKQYIKLNTNESPYPPSENAIRFSQAELKNLYLYPDPTCTKLRETIAESFGVDKDEVILGNGSDEVLYLAFLAFGDSEAGVAFPDITYSFYNVFATLCNLSYTEIPLKSDFKINISDYFGLNKTIFIANPNAPTGIALSVEEIEEILKSNPDNIVVIDEAYVDFGGESCIPLINKYDNLLVVQTFSKSRSMAGARLGMGIGSKAVISDLNTIKYSINPYNINKATMAAGIGAITDEDYTQRNCKEIIKNREYTERELSKLGFEFTKSKTNFVFAKHPDFEGEEIYKRLKDKGVLVRHFSGERIKDYNRITIGTKEQMEILINTLKDILEGK